ncbi:MAG: sporulation integral membrane protein YtvI [Oscillospiraceae bacterium]|jgi:sporulation integral membrane protein YtvI|nr:sporulation integral membrane protein YtvI [Oscillospiraceae bacterium]
MKPVKTWPAWARNTLYLGLALAALFVLFRWLLPVILPFALALALARLMEPGVRFLRGRWHIPRKAGAALLTLLLVAVLSAALWYLLSWLFWEVNGLIERAPSLIARLPEVSESLTGRLERWIEAAPLSLRDTLRRAAEGVLSGVSAIPAALVQKLTGWVTAFAGKLPYMLLFMFALILSTFLISAEYPDISQSLLKPFPENARKRILSVKTQFVNTLGKWLKAQGIMMLITFGELLTGFMLLKVRTALLSALLIALVDALPVLGAGICIVPWAFVSLLSGEAFRAAGLAVMFGVIVLVRGFTEPRLVGGQVGMGALPTFMAMYVGVMTAGVPGMIAFPIILMTVKQVWAPMAKSK